MAARLDIFTVTKKDENDKNEKGFWNKIGVMWAHKDGKGFSLDLTSLPVNGKCVAREPMPTDGNKGGRGGFNEPANGPDDEHDPF